MHTERHDRPLSSVTSLCTRL